jgi:hypothetical protein
MVEVALVHTIGTLFCTASRNSSSHLAATQATIKPSHQQPALGSAPTTTSIEPTTISSANNQQQCTNNYHQCTWKTLWLRTSPARPCGYAPHFQRRVLNRQAWSHLPQFHSVGEHNLRVSFTPCAVQNPKNGGDCKSWSGLCVLRVDAAD